MANDRTDEILRHFDLVAEAVQGQIAQVGEGVVLSNERLGRIEARLDRVESRLDRVETRSEALESEMRTGFAEVKSMISSPTWSWKGECRASNASCWIFVPVSRSLKPVHSQVTPAGGRPSLLG
jgi:hypothetical protein